MNRIIKKGAALLLSLLLLLPLLPVTASASQWGTAKQGGYDADAEMIIYKVDQGAIFDLSVDDFAAACKAATGGTLDRIDFTVVPSWDQCYLCYHLLTPLPEKSCEYEVGSGTFYVNGTIDGRYISMLSYATVGSFVGTSMITYTGYDTDGASYTGTVKIIVGTPDADPIRYTTFQNTELPIKLADLQSACRNTTGEELASITVTLPDPQYGSLGGLFVQILPGATLYPNNSENSLSKLTFTSGYLGTVTLSYIGTTTDGKNYTGTIEVTVVHKGSVYYVDVGSTYQWAVTAIDYLYHHDVISGTKYYPGDNMKRGDAMLMLCNAFKLTASTSDNFSDVSPSSAYYNAVAVAKALGIAKGADGKFYPESAITRQDMAVLIGRTLDVLGLSVTKGTASDLSGFTDKGKISSYATQSMATLVKAGILKGSDSKLNPTSNITRAEMAVIVYRLLMLLK